MRNRYAAGQKFHRMTLIERVDSAKWLCRCDCGTEKTIVAYDAMRGKVKSCGCFMVDRVAKLTREQVAAIKAKLKVAKGRRGVQTEIARAYGVSRKAIGLIDRGEAWKDVQAASA